jgi:hypothetical protein
MAEKRSLPGRRGRVAVSPLSGTSTFYLFNLF